MRLPQVLDRTILYPTVLLAALTASCFAQPLPTLPSVTSYSLDKVKVTLPEQLSGQQNVVILYFRPDQGDAAVAWATALQPVKYAHPGLQAYILPVYSRENFLYRWWIGAALRSSAPPAQEWHSTIPIFVDKNTFLPALKIATEKHFVILLTDKSGHVEWRTEGPVDESKMSALVTALTSSSPPSGHAALTLPASR